jgi:hypothetical protein
MRRRNARHTVFQTRAPRKGTLIVACALYVAGLFGYLGWLPLNTDLSVAALTVAGGLLILGALLRDL